MSCLVVPRILSFLLSTRQRTYPALTPAVYQQPNPLLNQSIRLETALDEKHFQSEQPLDYKFVSPFPIAALAANIALQPSTFRSGFFLLQRLECGTEHCTRICSSSEFVFLDIVMSTLSAESKYGIADSFSAKVVDVVSCFSFRAQHCSEAIFLGSHK